jgi:methylglutaconyl-CoA hydratase
MVRVDRQGPVATMTLDSPENRNALSGQLLRELRDALAEVQADPEVRAVVLTGEGSVFCSGADLKERLRPPPVDEGSASLPEVLSLLVSLGQPVVARVNGHVRAGGMGLVAACDLTVARPSATFAFTEVRVGVAPAVIAVPARRVMERRAFARYALTGDPFGAAEAVAAGLLTAVAEDLDGWVAGVVGSFLKASPAAVAATKGLLAEPSWSGWEGAMTSAELLSDQLFASADGIEGMAAFLDKRPAHWVADWGLAE